MTPRERTVALIRQLRRYKLATPTKALPQHRYPDEIIHAYHRGLKLVLDRSRALIERDIVPRIGDFRARLDADDFNGAMDRIGRQWEDTFSPGEAEAFAQRIAERTSDFQREMFREQARAALGVEILAAEPNLVPRMEAFVSENVALIRSVPREFLASLAKNLARELAAGTPAHEIAELIEDYYGVAAGRAATIARDQVGKFYAQLTMLRQRASGVREFIWRDQRDDKVRDSHRALNGHRFFWDDLPAEGAPGTPINCRCYPEPVFDGILADVGDFEEEWL